MGDAQLARSLGVGWARMESDQRAWRYTVLAELDGESVGVMQAGVDLPEFRLTPAVVLLVLRIAGPWRVFRLLPRFLARGRVMTRLPQDAYCITELDVDPRFRNRGIGGSLLRHADEEARRLSATRMALSTTTANPARRLYERHGYRTVETRTNRDYERYTGIEGRILMLKELG